MFVNLIRAGWGNQVAAEFDGLAEHRVAVICVSYNSAFGPSSAADRIAQHVGNTLTKAIPKITVVDQESIADWIDRSGWNEIDYRELGKGVDAELVVAINLRSFSLHEGKTLYKGKSEVQIQVYDLTDGGRVVYKTEPPQMQYPKIAGIHTTDMSEADFEKLFIEILSQKIARHFYSYDFVDDFGSDAISIP